MKKRLLLILIVILLAMTIAGCSTASKQDNQSAQEKTITDMDGNAVQLPAKVEKIGTSWPGFINTLCVAGGADKIVASSDQIKNYPWALKIFPNLSSVNYPFSTAGTSIEELIKNKPDVVFLRSGDDIDKIKEAGIPVVMIDYKNNSINDMVDAVTLVGSILGDSETKQAAKYKDFVTKNVDKINSVTSKVSDAQKPKVLALSVTGSKLSTWGSNIIQNEEIKIAGGVNVAENDISGSKEVSMEQVLQWNPDDIFLVGNLTDRTNLLNDSKFSQLSAVINGKVFVVPKGVFVWSNLGSETALYLPWMAKNLYPDQLKDLDISAQTKDFYKTFFNYNLSDDELTRILNAQDPQ
ncbi:ABC transporter substrate-binding protein [Acetobacterium tundrae]|nr:ABC transporter substrate-binding protein [Acetobacterium tundrae]